MLESYKPSRSVAAGAMGKYLAGENEAGHQAEYRLGHAPAPGDGTRGKGWAHMGLEMGLTLTPDQFVNLWHGRHPDTGEQLIDTRFSPTGYHQPGTDLNVSPPKSYSVLHGLDTGGKADDLARLHAKATQVLMNYIESNAKVARPKVGGVHQHQTADLLWTVSTHHTARGTKITDARGTGGDFQLHSHCWLWNMAYAAGRFRSIDHRGVVHVQKSAQAAYTMTLIEGLRGMGIPLTIVVDKRGRRDFVIDCATHLDQYFSTRTEAIHQVMRRYEKTYGEAPNHKTKQEISRETREGSHDHGEPDRAQYIAALLADGKALPELKTARYVPKPLAQRKAEVLQRVLGAEGLHRAGEKFQRWQIAGIVYNEAIGDLNVSEAQELLEEVLQSDELVMMEEGREHSDYDLLTTKTDMARARETVEWGVAKARLEHPAPSPETLHREINKASVDLSDEQVAMAKDFASPAGLVLAEGEAGTGKTTVIDTVVRAYRADDLVDRVILVSLAGSTVQRLGPKLKADMSLTVEGLQMAHANGKRFGPRDLIIVDESVMVDSARFLAFKRIAEHAIIRYLGDRHQLQAIGSGGVHVELADRLGFNELKQVFRQKHEWYVDAVKAIRAGGAERALGIFKEHGGLHREESNAGAINALLKQWDSDRAAGVKTSEIVVTTDQPNVVIDQINRMIQDRLLNRGELRGKEITIMSKDMTRLESFYEKDLVILTEGYDANTEGWVRNGTAGYLEHIDYEQGIGVMRSGGSSFHIPLEYLRLNYAGHATRSQGGEGKLVYTLPGGYNSDCVSAYSMTTRGEEMCHIFISEEVHGPNPEAQLAHQWSQFNPKLTAERQMDINETMNYEPWDPQAAHEFNDAEAQRMLEAEYLQSIEDSMEGQRIHRRRHRDDDDGMGLEL